MEHSSKTYESEIKQLIDESVLARFNYKQSGYFKRISNISKGSWMAEDNYKEQKALINYGEFELFKAWYLEVQSQENKSKIQDVSNEDMPDQDHQVLKNLYFGQYPNSTKAKNAIRRMIKSYTEKYHDNNKPVNGDYLSDLLGRYQESMEWKSKDKLKTSLRRISVYENMP
jgi:hypothetical protein